jgi:PIN domain nuclease of toxin-antitoxin system
VYNESVKSNFTFLPLDNLHLINYSEVPIFEQHRDPFDRLLIAIANEANATVITSDKNFELYQGLIRIFG